MDFLDRLGASWQTIGVLDVSSAALGTAPLLSGVVVLAMLYGLQYAVARVRRAGLLQGALDNSPLGLVADGRVLTENLDHARVSDAELWSQLRSHGVQRLEQVERCWRRPAT